MVNGRTGLVLQHLRRLASARAGGDLTDQQQLDRFVDQQDQTAFEALLRRHGPMVWRIAHRVLSNSQDAEDVLQATFLTLARRAASIRKRGSVASWLHGVAYRIAMKTRTDAAKRHAREKRRPAAVARDPLAELTGKEICRMLDEELNQLPEKCRSALVLCLLEGRTRDEAAQQLGLSLGTLKRRLEQGRELLHKGLLRRGLALSAVLSAVAVTEATAVAALPTGVIATTVHAACLLSAGKLVPGILSAKVANLSEGVMRAMFLSKLKITTLLLAISMIGLGTSLFAYRTLAGEKAPAALALQDKAKPPQNQPAAPAKPKTDKDKLQGTWIVESAEADGKAAPDDLKSLKLVFVGDKVIFHYTEAGNDLIKDGAYKLESKKDPKEIDFTCDNRTQEAIYTFEKDRLKLALAEHGQNRPTKFTAPVGTRQAVIVFKRDKEVVEPKDPKEDLKRSIEQAQDREADKGQAARAKAKPEPSFDYTAPITVIGRVLNDQRKPIPGATVYLASVGAVHKRLAEAKSDDKGNYEFRDVKLPVKKARPGQFRDLGAFELFGQAPGFGFGWRTQKWFYPNPAPAGTLSLPEAPDPKVEPHSYEAGDQISLDLTLRGSAHIAGRIVDERGRPIRQAQLRIVHCEPLAAGAESRFSALAARESVPPSMNLRATDDEGRFDFSALPPECRFQILVQPKDYPQRWIWAATTSTPQPAYGAMPVLIGDLKLTFAAPVEVPIRVIFGDSQKPAAKVLVTLDGRDASAAKETDADGRVTLRVPPGEYHFSLIAARGMPYLENLDKLVVGKNAPAEPIVGKLRPAGIIEVNVLDKDTGAGIEGVDCWLERGDGVRLVYSYRLWDKQMVDFVQPRSDKNGKLRVLIEPGKHRIGVGLEARPDGFVVVESDGQETECLSGKPVEVRFTMRKQ